MARGKRHYIPGCVRSSLRGLPETGSGGCNGFSGEGAFRDVYPELCGDFESYSPSFQGRLGGRGYPPDDAVDSRKDGPGIKSDEESERGLLGR